MLLAKRKDLNLRKKFYKFEHQTNKQKFLLTNSLSKLQQFDKNRLAIISFFSNNAINKSNKIKLIRRCILHNRSRGSIRLFGISRIVLRELLLLGVFPGYKKSSW